MKVERVIEAVKVLGDDAGNVGLVRIIEMLNFIDEVSGGSETVKDFPSKKVAPEKCEDAPDDSLVGDGDDSREPAQKMFKDMMEAHDELVNAKGDEQLEALDQRTSDLAQKVIQTIESDAWLSLVVDAFLVAKRHQI